VLLAFVFLAEASAPLTLDLGSAGFEGVITFFVGVRSVCAFFSILLAGVAPLIVLSEVLLDFLALAPMAARSVAFTP
jgi:hypothetical protein